MSDEQMFPKLSEEGQREFLAIIASAKKQITKAAEEAIANLYCDIGDYIESDAWINVKNSIMAGLCNYNQGSDYDNKRIRHAIFMEHRDEILRDVAKDLVEENKELKEDLRREREYQSRRY